MGGGVVCERITERGGSPVGRVRVPEVHVEEPVLPSSVTGQPVGGHGSHLVRSLQPKCSEVVALVEAGIEVIGRVPLGKGAEGCCEHAFVAEHAHPAVAGGGRAESSMAALREWIG